jgi:hypothetical protein
MEMVSMKHDSSTPELRGRKPNGLVDFHIQQANAKTYVTRFAKCFSFHSSLESSSMWISPCSADDHGK